MSEPNVDQNAVSQDAADQEAPIQSDYKVVEVAVSVLRPHPRNERIYGIEPIDEGLCRSIQELGIDTPLEITADYTVVKGHRRLKCAAHLGLKTVPCRIREDLKDDNSIIYSLIEDNRHQRSRTHLQKQRETEELIRIIQARRAWTGNQIVLGTAAGGDLDISSARDMPEEEARKLDQQIANAQEKLPEKKQGASYSIALKMSGMSPGTYGAAKRINDGVDKLREMGKEAEAKQVMRTATESSLSAAERELAAIFGETKRDVAVKNKKKKVSRVSQCQNCIDAIDALQKLLPEKSQPLSTARTILSGLKEKLAKEQEANAGD